MIARVSRVSSGTLGTVLAVTPSVGRWQAPSFARRQSRRDRDIPGRYFYVVEGREPSVAVGGFRSEESGILA